MGEWFMQEVASKDIDALKKRVSDVARERDTYKRAKEYDPETLEAIRDADTLREEWVGYYTERGVPADLFEGAASHREAKRLGASYLRAQTTKKADAPAGDDLEARVEAAVAKALGLAKKGESANGAAKEKLLPGGVGTQVGRTSMPEVFDPRGGHVKQMLKAQAEARR